MRHFPIFVAMDGQRVVVSGAGETSAAKLRLLMKTTACLHVFGDAPSSDVLRWASEGSLTWHPRPVAVRDMAGARLVYAANDDDVEDERVRQLARDSGVLINVVDNLSASEFITPAIVDRDPVTVAIGTEGTSPVLARMIKADVEEHLPSDLGLLARIASRFRRAAERIPAGRARRLLWGKYFGGTGRSALAKGGEAACATALSELIDGCAASRMPETGRVLLVGAGPGDPELLTIKARNALHDADVVFYDQLVDLRILDLARREATLIEVGKKAGAPSWRQEDIDSAVIRHASNGAVVVRLKSGDPMVFGRADEELDAYEAAGITCEIVPGITSAIAASARMRRSLTRRGRNSGISFLTAHDVAGFAEHEWRSLVVPGAVTGIYMGVKAARFVQGRLLLHGAAAETPVTIVENVSRYDEKVVSGTLLGLHTLLLSHDVKGPAIIFIGLASRDFNFADLSTMDGQVLSPCTGDAVPAMTGV